MNGKDLSLVIETTAFREGDLLTQRLVEIGGKSPEGLTELSYEIAPHGTGSEVTIIASAPETKGLVGKLFGMGSQHLVSAAAQTLKRLEYLAMDRHNRSLKGEQDISREPEGARRESPSPTEPEENRNQVGDVVARAIEKVGIEGAIIVEEGLTFETELDFTGGIRIEEGLISPYMYTNPDQMEAVLYDPYILIVNRKLSSIQELLPVLERVKKAGQSLVIIAEDVEGDCLATLVVNNLKDTFTSVAVKAPGSGNNRSQILEDIAILTGGEVITEETFVRLKNYKLEQLARARRVVVSKDSTTIIDGDGEVRRIEGRINQIKTEIENTNSELDREELQRRLAKLAGGVAVIRVGAPTEAEMMKEKQRIEESLASIHFRTNPEGNPEEGSSPHKAGDGRPLEIIMSELEELIGLDTVKTEVQSLLNVLSLNSKRRESGLKPADITFHLVFTGPPGTGKTTVARLYGELLGAMGMLSGGHLVEVSRQDLVAEYVGQTAVKTDEVLDRSMGGVLFIDEAYSLTSSDSDGDFGREAVETILKRMEDDREDFAVVVAGYTSEMEEFIDSNPGLESRFTQSIDFPSYQPEELLQIFYLMAGYSGYRLTENAHQAVWSNLYRAWDGRDESFGNARYVRKLLELIIRRQANRLAAISNPKPEELMTLEGEDIPAYASS